MKRNFSILVLGLCFLINAEGILAQSTTVESYLKENTLNKALPGVEQLDSTVTETWDTITNQFVISGKD